jgi:hypothetical protein
MSTWNSDFGKEQQKVGDSQAVQIKFNSAKARVRSEGN